MQKSLLFSLFLCLFGAASFAQVNLTSGLVAYYPFNGTFNDASGNGNHGTGLNGVTYGTDQWGNANNAAFFDGTNDWIDVGVPSFTFGHKFSIAFRFKTNTSIHQCIMSKSDYSSAPVNFQFQVAFNHPTHSPKGLYLGTNHNGTCTYGPSGDFDHFGITADTIVRDQWTCVVVKFDSGVKSIYLNGVLKYQATVTTGAFPTTVDSCTNSKFRIGSWWQGGPWYFSGLLDEVRLYNRALNTQEIDSLCNLVTSAPVQNVINKYAAVTGYAGNCLNAFSVDDATGFAAGDTVLMIQMKGATIDSTNSSSFGSVLNYNGAGNYEFNIVTAVSGNTIALRYNQRRTFDVPGGRVQLVRVPYFQNYTVNQPLTCLPWNGSKGGIVVLNASGTVTLNAPIDVSERGFRNGALQYAAPNAPCNQTDYYYASGTNPLGAAKGEGIAELSSNRNHGRGAQANGGGGGNAHNTGGAGGGNAGAGGTGGKETALPGCSPAQPVGGLGGLGLTYSNTLNKVFMGGGSGAGHANDSHGGIGTPGGGIVLLMANQVVGNGQTIFANGGHGIGFVGDCWDGQPGGSAGGSVLMHVNSYSSSSVSVSAVGGNGASKWANNTVYGATGPGGGGGGGALWVKGASMPTQITAALSGGANGVFLNNNDPWGATAGQAGTSLSGLSIGFPSVTDTFRVPVVNLGKDSLLCPGDTITLNAGNAGSIYLYSTGATTQTTKITTGGVYSVAVSAGAQCTVRDTIVISNGVNPVVKLGNDTAICPAATITLNGGNFGSGFAYLYSNSATTQTTNITAAGTYTLRVTNLTTGCRGRDTIVIAQGVNPLVNLGVDTAICPAKTITLNAGNIGSTYLYNTGATTQTINVTAAGTYSVLVTNATKCIGRDTIVIVQGVDPVVNLGPDTSACEGVAITVDAGNPGSSYLYSTGGNTQTHSFIPTGSYWVRVTTAQGCVAWDTVNIYVLPRASVNIITPTRTGPMVVFTSDAMNAATYLWSFGDGTTANVAAPTHTYAANGTYAVQLVVTNQCATDTVRTTMTISGVSTADITPGMEGLSHYPDPASTTITLDNKSTWKMQSLTVLNSAGAVVLSKQGIGQKKETLDVSSMPAGMYMIRILTDGGVIMRRVQVVH